MRSTNWGFIALGTVLGVAAAASAYADGGRELLLSGPIEQLDQGTSTVTVLGQKFKSPTDQLTVGEVVNVYGQIAPDGAIANSLVQATDKFGTNGDAVFLKGIVTGTDPALGRVEIDGLTIDYTPELGNADFSMPSVGDVVAVAGTQPAMKGVLVVSTTGLAAYAVGAPASGITAPAGMTGSGSKVAGMTGSGSIAAGMTGSGSIAAGMTGSGSIAAGMTGSGSMTAGMTGSGSIAAGMTGSGAKTAGMTGSGK